MKARPLLASAIGTGHVARDYIRLVQQTGNSQAMDIPPKEQGAQKVLGFFEEHNRPLAIEPAPPVKNLIKVLTHDMQGMPRLRVCGDGKEIGARLFTGCSVRLVGIPERKLIVDGIFWDHEAVRVKEVGKGKGKGICYTVPWDAIELPD
jgi:hypothetical protein